jgi:hypothetical protein
MRPIVFVVATVLIGSTLSAATWKEYRQPELGFLVEFPGDPAASMGRYHTGLVQSATAHIFSFKDDQTLYAATVVDLLERKEEGATLLGEAESNLTMLGEVASISVSRVTPGAGAVYGQFITIDCRSGQGGGQRGQASTARTWFKDMTGADCPDRSRLVANVFFTRGRLYFIQGINLPGAEDALLSPAAMRFANSLSFLRENAGRGAANPLR